MSKNTLVLVLVASVAGALLGNVILRSGRAAAQPVADAAKLARFKECIAVSLYSATGRELNQGLLPEEKQTVRIPLGWTVAGGTSLGRGGATEPAMVLCR